MNKSESLLLAQQGEELAERQLRYREVSVGRKPMAKHWPDEQESHMRQSRRMRGPRSLKSKTCTEGVVVDAAGISVKAGAHYPGRSPLLFREGLVLQRCSAMEGGEVSRGHSSCRNGNEGLNLGQTMYELDHDSQSGGRSRRQQPSGFWGSSRTESARESRKCLKTDIDQRSTHRQELMLS